MQCCGGDGATAGGGAISYVNVTDQSYYCVSMVAPYSDGGSGNSCNAGTAIIDSGTSEGAPDGD